MGVGPLKNDKKNDGSLFLLSKGHFFSNAVIKKFYYDILFFETIVWHAQFNHSDTQEFIGCH